MLKESLQKIVSSIILFFYVFTILPASELKFSMEKSLFKLDFYLEGVQNSRNEEEWQSIADKAVLTALKDWEVENIHLKEIDEELWKKYFEEAKNVFELEKNKSYAQWIFERSSNLENFESVFELREKIKENSTKIKAGTYSLEELNETVKKIEQENKQIIEEYIKIYSQKYLSLDENSTKTAYATELELKMLSEAEQNRLFLEYSVQKKNNETTTDAQTAEILSNILSKTTEEETSVAMEDLFCSLEKKIEAEKTNDAETQELLSQFKEVFNSGLSVWEKAETDFLIARSEWEEDAENVYLESEKLWIKAFETLQEKKTEWKNSIEERILSIQEKIKAENLSYESKIEQSLSEYALILTEEASKKYENSIAVVNIYSDLRNSLSVVYEGIISLCSLMEKENSQKYRGLYSYWKTENLENVGKIDENACKKILEIIENDDSLKEDSKAKNFFEWFELAKNYNQKIESVREHIFELSLEKEFEEEGFSEIELEIARLNALKKYWQEELSVANSIVFYLEENSKNAVDREIIYEKKKIAEENYNLAVKNYEDSLTNIENLSFLLLQEEEKLAASYEKITQTRKELEEKRAEYEKLYAANLETDEKTLVQVLLSYIENYENAENTKLKNQSKYYEKLYYELEKKEYEELELNEQKIKNALKNSAQTLGALKNEILKNLLETDSYSFNFDSFLENLELSFSQINSEKLWDEKNCIYNLCKAEFKTLRETLQKIDSLGEQIKNIKAEEEKIVSTSPVNSSLDEQIELLVLKSQAVLLIEYIENIENLRLSQLNFTATLEATDDEEEAEETKLKFSPDFTNLYWEIDNLIDEFTDDFSGDQERKAENLLETYSDFKKEIFTKIQKNTQNFIQNANGFKFSEIKKSLENTKSSLFNLLQNTAECNSNDYENVIDYCIKIYDFLEENNAGKSCPAFIENFFDSYLNEQAFFFANFCNGSGNLKTEEKIEQLSELIESKEKLLEVENTFATREELTQYLREKLELKFLTFYKTQTEESEVEWKQILAEYDFLENKFLDSIQKTKIKSITDNILQNQLLNLKENTRSVADVFGITTDERSDYSNQTLSELNDSYENYELSSGTEKKYQTKIEGLAQKFKNLNSREALELLNEKLSAIALAEENYKNAIEFYEVQTKDFVLFLEEYNAQIELSNNLYDETENARIERRKIQSVYDWTKSLYLTNSSYENYGDFKSPQEQTEIALNALNGINLALEKLEKIKENSFLLKDNSLLRESKAGASLIEADRNYYLAYVLYSEYLSAIEAEKKNVLQAQENEKYYRTALVKTLEEKDFVYNQFARVEYDSSLKKYNYSLCTDSFKENEEEQKKFFLEKTDSFSVFNNASESDENDATAAEKEICDWLTKMCQNESLFKTVVLAGIYWLSENDPSFENSIYSSSLNTHAEMGDAHGIGADDYYKKYIKEVAESSFNELSSQDLTEEIAKCVLFRNSNSIFAENIKLLEKNLIKSLAFELVENKMDSRKNDSDCTIWIIRFFTNIRVQNAKGRAAKNYSKRAQALKNSTFKIYENSFADILSTVKNFSAAKEQTALAFEKYSDKTGGIQKISKEKCSTDFVKNFFIQKIAENSLLKARQIEELCSLLEEDETFDSIETACETLLERHFVLLTQKNEEFNEANSLEQEEHYKKIENFRNSVELLISGEKCAEVELEELALDAFGNQKKRIENKYSILFEYYKKYFKEGRTFTTENFNSAESEYFILNNSLETLPQESSLEQALNYKQDFFSRYIEFYENLQTINSGFELALKKVLLDSSLNSIKKENEDQINRLLQIAFIADNEWLKAEEKLNSTYNSWARNFSKNYTKANEEWKNSYEEFLSEKQLWISQMYASASSEAGVVFNASQKADEALKKSIQKAKTAEINSVETVEFDSTAFVNEILKTSVFYSLKEHFGELEGRIGQSVFYSQINTKKSAGIILDYYNAQKTACEISQLMQETSAKLYAQKYSQNIEQNIEDSFNLVEQANLSFEGEIKNLVYTEGYDWKKEEISRKVLVHSYFFSDEYKKQTVHVFNWFKTEKPSISFSTAILNGLSSETLIQLAQIATQQLEEWKNRIFGVHTQDKDEAGEFEIHIGNAPENSDLKNGSGELGFIFSDIYKNNEEMLAGLSEMELAPWDKQLTASPVDWIEVPSLRTVCTVATAVAAAVVSAALSVASFGTLAAPLAALCAAGVSAALNVSTETAFAIMDLNGNYKDWDEVAKNLGTSVAVSSISALGGVAGSAVNLSSVAGTAVAKSSISVVTSATGTLASTAIQNAGDWNGFEKSFNSFGTWASVISGGAGSFVSNYLNTANLDGFNSAQIGAVKRFNSLAGGLTTNAFDFAFTGNTSFNVLNIADFKGLSLNANSGLVEMNAGKNGISFSLGTSGTDIGLSNLNPGLNGFSLSVLNKRIENSVNKNSIPLAATSLRSLKGFGGNEENTLLNSILSGKTRLALSDDNSYFAKTVEEAGGRTIYFSGYKNEMSREEQLQLGIILSHESYRNGKIDGNQTVETILAVLGHSSFAQKMKKDSLYTKSVENILSSGSAYGNMLKADLEYFSKGKEKLEEFILHIIQNYDSSDDYWKLLENGNIAFDGKTNLYDEAGNILYEAKSKGLESSLVEILLGGKEASESQLEEIRTMMADVFDHYVVGEDKNNKDNWYWNAEVLEANKKSEGLSGEKIFEKFGSTIVSQAFARYFDGTADKILQFFYGNPENLNAGNIENRSVSASSIVRFIDLLCEKNNFYKNIGPLVDSLDTTITGNFRDKVEGAYSNYNGEHFGIDIGGKNIEGQQILAGLNGKVVSTESTERDGNSIYIEYGYEFEGQFVASGLLGEYLHMQEESLLKSGDRVSSFDVVGKVGNSGTASTGPHLHYSFFTQIKNGKSWYSKSIASMLVGMSGLNDSMVNKPGTKMVFNPTKLYEYSKKTSEIQNVQKKDSTVLKIIDYANTVINKKRINRRVENFLANMNF